MTVECETSSTAAQVLVVGAGPAGLAVVDELVRRGMPPRVIDGANQVGQPWRDRHDQLRLNTHRRYSALPGKRFPRSTGAFPHRDDMVSYLEEYERRLPVTIEWGVTVERIEPDGSRLRAHTSHGEMWTDHVVVATGPDRIPHRRDLEALGLPRPSQGANTMLTERGISPATDDGFVAALATATTSSSSAK